MIYSSEYYRQAMLMSVVEVYLKIELLDRYENVIDVFEHHVSSDTIGDVSVDADRDIRRMFTLTFDNSDGKFTWNEGELIWIDNKLVRLFIGLNTSNGIEFTPLGTFVLTQPQATHKPLDNTVSISGQDKWYFLTGNYGRFTHETTIGKGTNIKEAIKIIAENAGVTKMILEDCPIELPYDLTYQIGQNRGLALKELTDKAFSEGEFFYDIYFDVNGYLRFEKHKNPIEESPCWTYKVEDQTLYAGSVRTLDDTELFNHILVIGGSSQIAEVRSEIVIDDTLPQFENHPYSIQKIGDRFKPWNNGNPDSNIDTQSQADARGLYEIKKSMALTEEVSLDIAPNYLHEANDVVEIIDGANGCNGNYQLKQFSIPINPKVTTARVLKIRGDLY